MSEAIPKVETSRVRVTERRLLPGESTGHHIHEYDYVVVPLTGGELTIVDAAGNSTKSPRRQTALTPGERAWSTTFST